MPFALPLAVMLRYTLLVKQHPEKNAALGHVDLVKVRVNSQVMQSVIARATRFVLRPVIVKWDDAQMAQSAHTPSLDHYKHHLETGWSATHRRARPWVRCSLQTEQKLGTLSANPSSLVERQQLTAHRGSAAGSNLIRR